MHILELTINIEELCKEPEGFFLWRKEVRIMTPEPANNGLSEEQKRELAKDIERNGGEVVDPNFRELEDWLRRNPPD